MEDRRLDACAAYINSNLLRRARELIGADSGVFVMRPSQYDALEQQGFNIIRVMKPDSPARPPEKFTFHRNRDIPENEIHLETPNGRVKIVNVRVPGKEPNPFY